ncbi:MAG TPA: selenide, water dikinase SelD [Actinomycetota bacterium]|nr:selenide, water dikinase SelD [Actinomycetota bacterium]
MPPPPRTEAVRLTSLSHGAGCACKLPLAALDELMLAVGPGLGAAAGDLLVGAGEGDDAAVYRLDGSRALVVTTDFFTPIVDDARDWGRVAAANALSDVYAMGGRPLVALNLTAWPAASLPLELLAEVLRGGAEVAAEAGCLVVGGHSVDDPEPKYGMAVVGLADPDRLLTLDRARPGDHLVLTKPLGTGVVATALKRGGADPGSVASAVASMTALNAAASEAALAAGVRAATDVTGYGLLGHLHRMLRASGAAGEVDAARVPFLPGAAELAGAGFVSGGTRSNQAFLAGRVALDPGVPPVVATLLHDAQTSGGLLLAVPPGVLAGLVEDLHGRGLRPALVGRVLGGPAGAIRVRRLPPG